MLTESEIKPKLIVGKSYKLIRDIGLISSIKYLTVTSKYDDGVEFDGYLGMDYWSTQFTVDLNNPLDSNLIKKLNNE